MALETSIGPHRVLLGLTVSSSRSGDLTKLLSHFAGGNLQSPGPSTACKGREMQREAPGPPLVHSGLILSYLCEMTG